MKKSLSIIIVFLMVYFTGYSQDDVTEMTEERSTIIVIDDPAENYDDNLFYNEGQLCQHVRQIYQDNNEVLWIGTNVYGILRYVNDTLEYLEPNRIDNTGRITAILEDKDDILWFGTSEGLLKYDGKSFQWFNEENGLIDSEVWSVFIDSQETIWVGTMGGVFKMAGDRFIPFAIPTPDIMNPESILSPFRVTGILEDQNGTFWFGRDGYGITKYYGSTFTHISTRDGLPDNCITSLIEDSRGDIWVGSMYGGVSQFKNGVFINHTMNGTICGEEAYSFYEDRDGNIWFPAEHEGVFKYDGKEFYNYREPEGLNSGGIQTIYQDQDGMIWCGGWGGLFRLEANGTFKAMTKTISWR